MNRSTAFGAAALVLAAVFWSFTGIFVKRFFAVGLDGDTQNLFRYASATAGLWLYVVIVHRPQAGAALRRWPIFLLPAAFNLLFQILMVSSLYRRSIQPGFFSLLSQSSVLFSTGLAFFLFREERRAILSRAFAAGCLLAMAGTAGVILFGHRAQGDFGQGVFLALGSALLWSCYTLAIKPVVRVIHPVAAFASVAALTTVAFVPLSLWRAEPAQFFRAGALDEFLVALSGVACIGAAHALYFQAIRRLGVAVCASFLLIQPLFTVGFSAAILGERMNAAQMVTGVVLLAGAWLIIRARHAPAAPRPPAPPDEVC